MKSYHALPFFSSLLFCCADAYRLPHGARLAWEENACVVVLGTGASERDGVVEGR